MQRGIKKNECDRIPHRPMFGVSDKECRASWDEDRAAARTLLFRPWIWLVGSPEGDKAED